MPRQNNLGSSYRVDFWRRYADGESAPAAIELEGGPTPFLHSLSDVDDLLTPLRASTARISFCDDIALGDMLPADGFEWKVTLTRLDDGRQMFVGYLTAEVYTQPDIEGPNIVTVNAASPLRPIAATTMKLLGVGSLSIGHLIHSAISECEGIDRVYIPAQYTINKAVSRADFTDILRWQMSSANFIRTNDSGMVTGQDFECDNYSAALEAVCRLFGWCLTDVGDGALYFVSPGYTGEYMQLTKAQLIATEAFTPTMVTPSITNEGYLQPIDKGDTVDFRQGVGSAIIKAQPQSSAIEIPSVDGQVAQWSYARIQQNMWKMDNSTYDAEVGLRRSVLGRGQIVTPRYRATPVIDANGFISSIEWQVVEDGSVWDNDVIAEYIELDSCDPKLLQSNGTTPAEKREWNFQPTWKINGRRTYSNPDGSNINVYIPENRPYVTYRGKSGLLTTGAINISFDVRAAWNDAFYLAADYTFAGGNIEDTTQEELGVRSSGDYVDPIFWGKQKYIKASLSVGGKYWDGVTWRDYFSMFDIPVSVESAEWHKIASNKTIDMPYAGSEGWYIPITTPISGVLEFSIHTVQKYNGMPTKPSDYFRTGSYTATAYIKNISVTFANSLDYSDVSGGEATFYKDFSSSFTERKEITLPIHSRINSSEQMSLLYDSGVTAIDKVWRTTAIEAAKPEQFLLANVERLFASVSQKWRRGAEIMDLRPIDLFSRAGNKVMAMSGLTFNYAQSVVELNIAEVKSESSIRYVE